MADYEFKQHSVAIPMMDDLIAMTIRNRSQAAAEQIIKDFNTSVYGDRLTYVRPSLFNRIKGTFMVYRDRTSDAWGVLTGRLEVGSDW